MGMEIFSRSRSKQSVYVQLRQVERGKDGKMRVTKTKTITFRNATIEQVRALLESKNGRDGS